MSTHRAADRLAAEEPSIRETVDRLYRHDARRIFATLVRLLGDLDQAEEALHDAFRLIFTCCHPALSPDAQIALTLREVCGLRTEEIARAFLVPPATLAQRIVRAKAKIRDAKIPYRVPAPAELPGRLETVLRVVYLVFNEGYTASDGPTVLRADLSSEAIRLGLDRLERDRRSLRPPPPARALARHRAQPGRRARRARRPRSGSRRRRPLAETKERLTGFYLIEADDLDEALRLAAEIPPIRVGSIEARPIRPIRETVAAER